MLYDYLSRGKLYAYVPHHSMSAHCLVNGMVPDKAETKGWGWYFYTTEGPIRLEIGVPVMYLGPVNLVLKESNEKNALYSKRFEYPAEDWEYYLGLYDDKLIVCDIENFGKELKV